MSLSAGSATSGKTGALAVQFATGGVLYLPHGGFNPTIRTGRAIVPLVNNTAFSSNEIQGVSLGTFDLASPLILGLHNAAFFSKVVGYVAGDADSLNYATMTNYPDDAGSAAATYALVKFGTLSQRITFSPDGLASAIGQRFSGMSLDPESGTASALAAPSSGPLSNTGVAGYQQTALVSGGNTLDGVAQVDININVTLVVVPGKRAGTNSLYLYLAKGLLATNLTGAVSITQVRNAQYQIANDGILTMNVGVVGAGLAETLSLMPISIGKPTGLGINMATSSYAIKSLAGESPVGFADL